jgi:hypothetical protein
MVPMAAAAGGTRGDQSTCALALGKQLSAGSALIRDDDSMDDNDDELAVSGGAHTSAARALRFAAAAAARVSARARRKLLLGSGTATTLSGISGCCCLASLYAARKAATSSSSKVSGATSNSDGAGALVTSADGSNASRIETGDDDAEDADADDEADDAEALLLVPPNSHTNSEGASTSAVDTRCAPTPAPDGAAQRVRSESTMRCGRENGAQAEAAEAAEAADSVRAASETTMGGDAPFLAISITPARGRSVTHTRSPLTSESRSAVHWRIEA